MFRKKVKSEINNEQEITRFINFVVENIAVPSELQTIETWGNDILKELKGGHKDV